MCFAGSVGHTLLQALAAYGEYVRFIKAIEDEGGTISSRELEGYFYQGKEVDVWIERFSLKGKKDNYIASIRAKDGNYTELADSRFSTDLHKVLLWARKELDFNPCVFGEVDLSQAKAEAAIRGEGAELYIAGYIMLELGYIVSVASPNMPGYDLIVVDPQTQKSCRLQVKYRSNNTASLKFSSLDFDFLILVDKPYHEVKDISPDGGSSLRPIAKFDVWVLSREWVATRRKANGHLSNPRYLQHYHDWSKIVDFLSVDSSD
ncbi:hypothetical protein [Photobacterium sp. J15]|uniref:hypothetical protein n=1 Tax=Photobacterium sp. J15 TaxID=265901 RepID=UPI0007E3AEE9|nr:hypothetical protein [Photobacterium sp. J15]